MSTLAKLENYKRALYQWRAAQEFIKHHPDNCFYKSEPDPRHFELQNEIELGMAKLVREQALHLNVQPGPPHQPNQQN